MKKITLFAIMAILVLLVGCKKENKQDPQPEAKNPIVEALDYCKVFYHADSTKVYDQLVNDGWVLTKNDSTEFFSKKDDKNIHHRLSLIIEDGVVTRAWMKLYDENEGAKVLNSEVFKGCMTSVGEQYIFEDKTLSFVSLAYESGEGGEIKDYAEALNSVVGLYDGGNVYARWTSSKKSIVLGISKQFDEKTGRDFVQITFW